MQGSWGRRHVGMKGRGQALGHTSRKASKERGFIGQVRHAISN